VRNAIVTWLCETLAGISLSLLGPDVFLTTFTILGLKKMEITGKLCNEEPLMSIKCSEFIDCF
jgi:hypothetical protein